jgi:hypothetical protein
LAFDELRTMAQTKLGITDLSLSFAAGAHKRIWCTWADGGAVTVELVNGDALYDKTKSVKKEVFENMKTFRKAYNEGW